MIYIPIVFLIICVYLEGFLSLVVLAISILDIARKKNILFHIVLTQSVILLLTIINSHFYLKSDFLLVTQTFEYFLYNVTVKSIFGGIISILDYAVLYLCFRFIKLPIVRNSILIVLFSAYTFISIKTYNELSHLLGSMTYPLGPIWH